MIDPITEYMLEEEQLNALYELLTEAWMDPVVYGRHTASQFGIKWRAFNLATIDINKFNDMIDKLIKQKTKVLNVKSVKTGGIDPGVVTGLATAAVAAAVITIAYQGYKRFFSKAAKACKGGKGDAKTSCMNRYKVKALRKQLSDLQQGLISCDKTMDVHECREKIAKKIRKTKVKLGEF